MADSNEQPPAKKSRHESPEEDVAPTLKEDEDEGDKDGGNKDEDDDKDEDEGDDNNAKSDDDVGESDEDEPRKDDETKSDEKSEEDKEKTAFDTDNDDGTISWDEDADLIESRSKKEIPVEAVNMDEEKVLGKFDKDGHFVWNCKTGECTDAWLEGEGSKPVPVNARAIKRCQKIRMKVVEDDDTPSDDVFKQRLIVIENLMEDNKTVQGTIALLQLNRIDKNSSASERLANKKAGGSYSSPSSSKDCEENPLSKLLDAVDEFPLQSDIFSLTKSEIASIIA
ncbi:CD2 antigen cytoplasmic tail-binding protein 2 homolog [Nilaparvata lugens]|uniref:CD2 antigen cytoplasmic tail-binding protein 2 homolog n=1 Tax=Nilaparvata lugens TaxID=108931 RepID=UPI00193DD220|nr:CD2 antigen cytoplasmic tail-binding protein 2 homolog [Nilaparvata lugens]